MSEHLKDVYREMRDAGESRDRMISLSLMCACSGCALLNMACECGMRCKCRCTLPAVVAARNENRAQHERLIDEVLAER